MLCQAGVLPGCQCPSSISRINWHIIQKLQEVCRPRFELPLAERSLCCPVQFCRHTLVNREGLDTAVRRDLTLEDDEAVCLGARNGGALEIKATVEIDVRGK